MKLIIFLLSLTLSLPLFAANIESGRYNYETNKVELTVSYGGGCSEHYFKLELDGGCRESSPVQCDFKLIHTTDEPDSCKAYLIQKLELDLPSEVKKDNYYYRAFISILNSEVSFQLPDFF